MQGGRNLGRISPVTRTADNAALPATTITGRAAGRIDDAAPNSGAGGARQIAGDGVGNGGNRVATNADVSDYFQQNRKFWKQDPVQYNGNKVYQRNDLIDPSKLDPITGKTNIELMQAGRAPLGPDGKPVNLHHLTQKQDGAIAEVTQTLHKDNHGTLHMPNTVPSVINRTEFNKWRRNYWKNRANDF